MGDSMILNKLSNYFMGYFSRLNRGKNIESTIVKEKLWNHHKKYNNLYFMESFGILMMAWILWGMKFINEKTIFAKWFQLS